MIDLHTVSTQAFENLSELKYCSLKSLFSVNIQLIIVCIYVHVVYKVRYCANNCFYFHNYLKSIAIILKQVCNVIFLFHSEN